MNSAPANPSPLQPIRVLVVDDSAVMRQLISRELSRDSQIQVVGTAPDPYVARDKVVKLMPDVITLDVEMPRMDGITFLRKLMRHRPTPVIVISTLTARGTQTALDAMDAGAIDVLAKPDSEHAPQEFGPLLIRKVKSAAGARARHSAPSGATPIQYSKPPVMRGASGIILAIGASTGGVQALTEVLTAFPENAPPTLVVQHMPPHFTASFAQRLDHICRVRVKEARDGDDVRAGEVLLAPGGYHMLLRKTAARYSVDVKDGPDVHRQKPSVEVLFNSVARYAGAAAVGAILTGMGADGARGLLEMRKAGARTIAQDEATCIVFGMPMEAIKCGAAEQILPLGQIAHAMISLAQDTPASKESA
jgi:two-component system chemotaxis response regulator CheB